MMVSVCMITYGHEKFIREAIESVLMQQVNFEVELIIANDSSPDDTHRIIEEIQKNNVHASWIKYIRQEKNIGMTSNMLFAMEQCNGEYIAFCEGDDYWTDPLKLQKQKDYFSLNPNVGLICTGYRTFIQKSGLFIDAPVIKTISSIDEVYNELIKNNFIALLTVMAETKILKEAVEKLKHALHNWSMVDYPLWLYISSQRKIAYLPDCTAVYRYLPVSASHSDSLAKNLNFLKNILSIRLYFNREIKKFFPGVLPAAYFKFYYESYMYTYRKLKQKMYAQKNNR